MPAVLLYDGTCGFCAASVQFILRHERDHSLLFAPLQGEFASDLRRRHPELGAVDSMIWVEPDQAGAPERVLARSAAVMRVARYIGGAWRVAGLGTLVPRRLRDAAYDLVARHRHHLVSAPEQCYLPPAEVRRRFIA